MITQKKEEYILIRSDRKSLSLSIEANGRIKIRAPKSVRISVIERFIMQHAAWIERRRKELEKARPNLSDGASLELYGRQYLIESGQRARITQDHIFLPVNEREKALIALLKKFSRQYMNCLVCEYAAKYGFTFANVRISSARGRWGSCSEKGDLSFSFRTAFLSEREARYIAIHELCHTRHMNHGPAFWKEVSAIMPDCFLIRKGLKSKSARMLYL